MKKILATLALLAGALHILSAIPAYPGKIKVSQPDGSMITIRIHGDEWYHYVTDEAGGVIAKAADGFYRTAPMPSSAMRKEAEEMRLAAAGMRAQAAAQAPSMSQGTHRIPVVLVNFSDKSFVINDPATAFSNMLNQAGYSANGGTGSVHDYYWENSHGAYDPVFEVFGPVTVSKESSYYAGENGTRRANEALQEACQLLDGEIDFTRYDSDRNDQVDMILMYYAGHNQAEGGGTGTIWPHQSESGQGSFDGKSLRRYFCTSELKGASGNQMCGIGTTTHEFAHSLGLPDFYDTDYADHGSAGALYSFSVMCNGAYNNSGRTPPYFNSEELIMLGWMEDQSEITAQGDLTLEPIQDYVAYRTPATMDGEYFVYECRKQTGWDRYIPYGGMLVYHVDKAERESLRPGGYWGYLYTPFNLWNDWVYTNAINAHGSHPCFYLVPSAAQTSLNYSGSESSIPFPGNKRIKNYTPVDWQDSTTDFRFTDIDFDGSRVTLTVRYMTVPGVTGIVRNTSAKPIRGATVSFSVAGQVVSSVTTDADGSYILEDMSLADNDVTIAVTCDGYIRQESTLHVARSIVTCDFYLRKVDEPEESTFIKYDPDGGSFMSLGYGNASYNHAAGIRLSVEEVAAHAGKQIKLISFQPAGGDEATAEAYVFVEVGNSRRFTQKVEGLRFDAMNTVNVVGQEFYIPTGSEIYIGYGLVNCSEESPLLVQPCDEDRAGVITHQFNQTRANSWSVMQTADGTYYTPVISASVGEPVAPELGFNHIANPGNGTYAAGSRFDLALVRYEDDLPSSVSWVFDGLAVQADSVTLTAGNHTVEAHLSYPDGADEVIRLVIFAE